ncbi:MAG: hypothetical protein WDW38_009228 [Sanguina aurantia]
MSVQTASAVTAKPILLLDVMDTLVYDPFYHHMAGFFNISFAELLARKHPNTYLRFENNEIDEEEMARLFFSDGSYCDGPALRAMMISHYRYLDGIEALLKRLKEAGYEMHSCSNYPVWYKCIEEKLTLSRYLSWTFMSCDGPMQGHRKPAPEAYTSALTHLDVPASRIIFVDDRAVNVEGAVAAGMEGVLFKGAAGLEEALLAKGLVF